MPRRTDLSKMDATHRMFCCLAFLLAVAYALPRAAGIADAVQEPPRPPAIPEDGNMTWCRGTDLGGGVLSVSGQGKVSAIPDVATVSYTVSDTNSSAIAARDQASEVASVVLKALSSVNGIDPKNVTTSGINLQPETSSDNNGGTNITGYTYSLSYTATINNATGDVVSEIVDTAVRTGQDAITIDDVQFTVSDGLTAAKQSEARRLAVADAKSTALEYAKELGVQLGPVASVSDSVNSEQPPRPYTRAAQSLGGATQANTVSTPVTAEAADIIVNALMDFRICTAVA